jgi:hypothetical protein
MAYSGTALLCFMHITNVAPRLSGHLRTLTTQVAVTTASEHRAGAAALVMHVYRRPLTTSVRF